MPAYHSAVLKTKGPAGSCNYQRGQSHSGRSPMRDLNPIVGLSRAAVKEPDNERTTH